MFWCWYCRIRTRPGLGLAKELYLKLTLRMTEGRKTEPAHDEELRGGDADLDVSQTHKVKNYRRQAVSCPIDSSYRLCIARTLNYDLV